MSTWDAEGWVKPELIEDTILNQVTLKLDMVKAESAVEESAAVPKNAEECRRSAEEVPKSAEVDQMTKQEEVLYKYILEKGSITTADVCQLFDVKERRARDILSNMCKKNFLRKQVATSSTKYVLNKC